MTAAKMVSLLAGTRKKISELADQLPRRSIIKDKIATKRGKEILDSLPGQFPENRIDQTDGIKIFHKDAWVLVRASGTEPIIRIIIDSKNSADGNELYRDLKSRLNHFIS